jgi:membrane protein DedA with SNARE-associated domain
MLQNFLQEFGYFALFIGTFFEGETILVLAGFLAFREYMDIKLVVVVAFFGSYAGDQLWYYMGRRHGRKILARRPRWQLMGDKALAHVRKHPDIWVLSFRFVYGLRTVMPVAIGLSGYPPLRYLILNGIGAAVWATALGYAAYHFGAVLEGMLGNIKKYELWVLGALVLIGVALWIRRRFKNARIAREEAREEARASDEAAEAARIAALPAEVKVESSKPDDR